MKKLVIGSYRKYFKFEDLIILGPWSFLKNQSQLFDKKTVFEPDPYSTHGDIEKDSLIAQSIIDNQISFIVDYLNTINNSNYTKRFWKILIMPWLSTLIQITIERYRRIENLLKKYDETFEVELYTEDSLLKFKNTKDFFDNGVSSLDFNHWLFSRIIEINKKLFKISWIKIEPKTRIEKKFPEKQKFKEKIKFFLYHILPSSTVYGISFYESPFWEFLIFFKSFKKSKKRREKKVDIELDLAGIDWKMLIKKTLPEEFKKIPNNLKRPKPRFILVGQRNFYQINVEKKLNLAMHKEVGSRIICSQHGSRYGTLKCIPYINSVEYDQDWFISWGWSNQSNYDVRTINLPAPYLIKKITKKVNRILFIGQESPLYSNRLDSIPQPADYISIVNNIKDFINGLNEKNLKNLKFRFYPEKNCSIDYDFLFNDYLNSKPKYMFHKKHIFSSKLVIIDHPGTILHQRLALNLPTIGFWEDSKWGICDQAKSYFDSLRHSKIIFSNGLETAKIVNQKYSNLKNWWFENHRQKAITEWNNNYARTDKKWRKDWIKKLWNI